MGLMKLLLALTRGECQRRRDRGAVTKSQDIAEQYGWMFGVRPAIFRRGLVIGGKLRDIVGPKGTVRPWLAGLPTLIS
jgi:hypothetical protein